MLRHLGNLNWISSTIRKLGSPFLAMLIQLSPKLVCHSTGCICLRDRVPEASNGSCRVWSVSVLSDMMVMKSPNGPLTARDELDEGSSKLLQWKQLQHRM